MKIYCPKCKWEPGPDSRWACSCGHTWNTFTTRGRCPNCSKQWKHTQCLACGQWSPHPDWYHDGDEDLEVFQEFIEELELEIEPEIEIEPTADR